MARPAPSSSSPRKSTRRRCWTTLSGRLCRTHPVGYLGAVVGGVTYAVVASGMGSTNNMLGRKLRPSPHFSKAFYVG